MELKLEDGQIQYSWNADLAVDVECILDYTPEERGTRDEPGNLANAVLVKAFIRDIDIGNMLTSKQIGHIEEQAIRDMERRIKEARDEQQLVRAGL